MRKIKTLHMIIVTVRLYFFLLYKNVYTAAWCKTPLVSLLTESASTNCWRKCWHLSFFYLLLWNKKLFALGTTTNVLRRDFWSCFQRQISNKGFWITDNSWALTPTVVGLCGPHNFRALLHKKMSEVKYCDLKFSYK